jgi:dsDNA-binding SOS-regulon protein
MAVESRFVVIRQGVEVETFMDKKAADEYDKMLDMADSLAEMFETTTLDLDEKIREELCIYLAKNREDVLVALQAKKAKPPAAAKKAQPKIIPEVKGDIKAEAKAETSEEVNVELVAEVKKPKAPRKAKASKTAA